MEQPTQEELRQAAQQRVAEAAILHLVETGGKAVEIGDSLVDDVLSIEPVPYDAEHRRERGMEYIVNCLDYVAEGMRDLRLCGFIPDSEKQGPVVLGEQRSSIVEAPRAAVKAEK